MYMRNQSNFNKVSQKLKSVKFAQNSANFCIQFFQGKINFEKGAFFPASGVI